MIRVIILFLIACLYLYAEVALEKYDNENNKIFELFADNVDSDDYTSVVATGNAVVISRDMYIIADYIKYNTKTREAQIKGNVKFYRDGSLFFSSQDAFVKFDESYFLIEPFYMQDSRSGVWISASSARGMGNKYNFRDVIFSGCDIDGPIWHIEGSSGTYNHDIAIASIWNPRIYIKNIPIMYLPYLFVSTQSKRTTGLLYPEFANSSLDGFIYIQPFFLALQNFWDVTFSPQLRSTRGFGGNVQIRVLDAYDELFLLNTGFFWSGNDYKRKYNIENQFVFGFDFHHQRRDILTRLTDLDSDGLYLNFNYMNDLDHIRLQSAKDNKIENRLQTSKANYFLSKDSHYFGIYFKYFLDLSKLSNNDTFQTLPQIQYHRSLEQAYFKNLLYALDVNSKSVSRSVGFGYIENNMKIPLYISTPILANYLTAGANLNINASIISLNRLDNKQVVKDKDSSYFGTTYSLFIGSDIARQYNKMFHTMSFNGSFNSPLYQYFKDDNNVFNPTHAGIYGRLNDIAVMQQQIQLSFSQYFFTSSGDELIYHRIYQDINPKNDKDKRLSNLRNELGYSPIRNVDIVSTIFYSHVNRNIDEASLSFSLVYGYFKGNFTYFLKKKFEYLKYTDLNKYTEETANFFRLKLSHDFEYFALYGDIGYDFKLRYLRDWNVVVSKDIRCFGIGLRFANEVLPILTTSGARTVKNRYISLELRFVPATSTSVSYRFKETGR